jgi:hypothetical protein
MTKYLWKGLRYALAVFALCIIAGPSVVGCGAYDEEGESTADYTEAEVGEAEQLQCSSGQGCPSVPVPPPPNDCSVDCFDGWAAYFGSLLSWSCSAPQCPSPPCGPAPNCSECNEHQGTYSYGNLKNGMQGSCKNSQGRTCQCQPYMDCRFECYHTSSGPVGTAVCLRSCEVNHPDCS